MKRALFSIAVAGLLTIGCQEENPVLLPLKLDYYEETFDIDGIEFKPHTKVVYTYDASGKLTQYTFYAYNPDTDQLEKQRYFQLTYEANQVSKLEGFLANPVISYVSYNYTYATDGRVSKITEHNSAISTSAEANFNYDASNNTVKVTYTYSHGGGFEYEYVYDGGNILSDKTTRGSQLCSDGAYTYDQSINPFAQLGYVDFVLQNISTNNRLSEDVNYVGCGFPSFVPDSYTYEYNDRGYPIVATTTYNPGEPVRKSEKRFFYKQD